MVYIILLNWNGWRDTIKCLESVLRSSYDDFRVAVCDNDSEDGSLEKIKEWADGKIKAEEALNPSIYNLIHPGVTKPVSSVQIYKGVSNPTESQNYSDVPLVLIQNGANIGFSAGNNEGIKFALESEADYIWLLNNDTVIRPNALQELVTFMEGNKEVGICGTVINRLSAPEVIQTFGGGKIKSFIGLDRFVPFKGEVDYISGTSLFVRSEVFRQIGALDEAFFFYWEDVDFSYRARKNGWALGVAENAVIYHKLSSSVVEQSLKSDLYKVESLIRFNIKHQPRMWLVPVVFNISAMVLNRILRGQFNRILPIITAAFRASKS